MRHHAHIVLGLALALTVAACGNDGGGPGGGGDDDPMEPTPDGGGIDPPRRGFQVVSPEVTINPGQEITYCYYFRTPNTEELAIKKWVSVMTPGSHHMIMYTTPNDTKPPGTIDNQACGNFSINNAPSWTYSAQTPANEVALPADDGAGKPLGQKIAPNTPAYFQMHYLNSTDDPLRVRVTLNAEAHDAGVAYTQTAPYITYNNNISIPPNAIGDTETQTCNVPQNIKFWTMSTHAHKQAVRTTVKDGTTIAFTSQDWEHPGAASWTTAPFFTFATNKLTYECEYNNTGTNKADTVVAGPSAETNEMCMAVGYYFPATKSLMCFNNLGPF